MNAKKKSAKKKFSPKKGKPKLKVIPAKADFSKEDKKYFAALHEIVDMIFTEASEVHQWTWNQLAIQSRLSYPTVSNLGERITKFPRYQTVYKLARAIGWNLSIQPNKIPVAKKIAV